MKALFEVRLSDDVIVDEYDGKAVNLPVEAIEHIAVDITMGPDEIRDMFHNTVAVNIVTVIDKAFLSYNNAVAATKEAYKKKKEAEEVKKKKETEEVKKKKETEEVKKKKEAEEAKKKKDLPASKGY